jgi:hypothetical protein
MPDKKHEARLDWLRAHPALLAQLPGVTIDPTRAQTEAIDVALRGMQIVRLYAATTDPKNARWDIRLCVSELRGEAVSDKDRRWALRGAKGI